MKKSGIIAAEDPRKLYSDQHIAALVERFYRYRTPYGGQVSEARAFFLVERRQPYFRK
jgi:hypothetical protein